MLLPEIAEPESPPAGQLLRELEQRQDEALSELDVLEKRVHDVLESLGVAIEEEFSPDVAPELRA